MKIVNKPKLKSFWKTIKDIFDCFRSSSPASACVVPVSTKIALCDGTKRIDAIRDQTKKGCDTSVENLLWEKYWTPLAEDPELLKELNQHLETILDSLSPHWRKT